jgi:hypothetical protein
VEEVQAVGGGRVSGTAGELPPPDGFFRFLGEVELAIGPLLLDDGTSRVAPAFLPLVRDLPRIAAGIWSGPASGS